METTVTVINVLDVDAERQGALVALLDEGTEQVVRHRAGFVSVTLLASHDGARVVNLAQWRSLEDVRAAFADPAVQDLARRAADLADASPHVYSVVARH